MNKIKIVVFSLLFAGLAMVNAQTNVVSVDTNAVVKVDKQAYELTIGGAGSSVNGQNEVGADFSLSTNPFKQLPSVWVGVSQSVYWSPTFYGSTDFTLERSTHLYKELYVNTGWSAGVEYGNIPTNVRTGPEVTLEYYIGDSSFLYTGVNYDIGQQYSGFRYSFGIGVTF